MDELTFIDRDGVEVFLRRWLPVGDPRWVVVLVHGASEHSGRYARVAEHLNAAGYAVYALDIRGHGRTADSTGPGRIGPRGMEGAIDDVRDVIQRAREENVGLPLVLFGHSMGSAIVQTLVEHHGEEVDAYVLSGAMGRSHDSAELAAGIRQAVDAGMGDEPLDMLGGVGAGVDGARTAFDWLSRDPDEVDRYIADPLCGDDFPLTYGFVAALLETVSSTMGPDGVARVPKHLPVLLLTGDADPVSNGGEQVRALERLLRDAGLDVEAKYYKGARHEVLNEINRDEVHADLVNWIARVTPLVR